MSNGFQQVLDHIRSIAGSEFEKGYLFERLMKTYFTQDPLYRDRFLRSGCGLSGQHCGRTSMAMIRVLISLREESEEGYCAIQCKCYAPGTRISKSHLDSFISASAREPFTARIVVDTGDEWGPTAVKTIKPLTPACSVIRFGDLASRPFDWPDLVKESQRHCRIATNHSACGPINRLRLMMC